jgi:phosphate transport system permease protein
MNRDKLTKGLLFLAAAASLVAVAATFIVLLSGSLSAIKKFGLEFLFSKTLDPITEDFGIIPFVYGTLVTSAIAILLALPFGVSIGVAAGFLFKNRIIQNTIAYLTDLLAGIPSVIYGLWGLFVFVPFMRNIEMKLGAPPYGIGILTAGIILALMIIPYISSIVREAVQDVPLDFIEAGYSLGATKDRVVFKIIFPNIKESVVAGTMLALSRALGETMAVTMVIGNSLQFPKTLFEPGNTIASLIANEFTEATKDIHLSSLIYAGLWLFIITFSINLASNVINRKIRRERSYV